MGATLSNQGLPTMEVSTTSPEAAANPFVEADAAVRMTVGYQDVAHTRLIPEYTCKRERVQFSTAAYFNDPLRYLIARISNQQMYTDRQYPSWEYQRY